MLSRGLSRLLWRQQEQAVAAAGRLWARNFAEQAISADAAEYAPPVPVHGTAGRYAAALYMAGAKADKLDEIEEDLDQINDAAEESEEFRNFLKDPSIPKQSKQEALDAVLDGLKVSDLTKNFFGVLTENNRLSEYMKISTTFDELLAAARGEVVATITTAEALPEADLEEISDGLLDLLEDGQELLVQEQVDPSIIGGIVIDIGDKHIDLSISSRIKKIQQLVLQNV